jgi:SH3-like domain-containing protein
MIPRPVPRVWRIAALLLVTSVAAKAAFTVGGTAYTKRLKTTLLAEPSALAAPAGNVSFGHKLAIKEIRGNWLRVSEGSTKGWVFVGNVTDTKPAEGTGADKLGMSASATTATAAARPLTPAASEYADRRNLGDARGDLNWLNTECRAFTPAEVEKFLQEKKKGEFQ